MSRSGTATVLRRVVQSFAPKPWLAALLALSFTAPAMAGSDANGDDPQLEAPIQQGIALRKSGNDEAALSLFLELEQTNPESIRVLLHITAAAQATGRWMMAHTYLQKAYAHKSEPYFIRYRSAIKSIEDATALHVGQFRAVGEPPGAEIRLNGELVGTLPMSDAKPIEVGQYVLEVTKPGFYPLRRSVAVAPGNALTQEAVELRAGSSTSHSLGVGSSAGAAPNGDQHWADRDQWWRAGWVTWTLASATVLTATTSALALVYRNDRADRWNSSTCLDGTKTRQEVCSNVRDDISLGQNVAIGSGIAAIAFGGLTITQAILASERPAMPSTTARANGPSLRCSPGLGSIACFGSF